MNSPTKTQTSNKSKLRYPAILAAVAIVTVVTIWTIFKTAPVPDRRPARVVKVLALLPLTGPGAEIGEYVKKGFDSYFAEKTNSVIRLIVEDSKTNPKEALSILQQACLTSKPDLLIAALSGPALAVLPKAGDENLFVLVTSSTSDKVTAGATNVQRIYPNAEDWTGAIADFAHTNYSTVVLIHSADELGLSAAKVFRTRFESPTNQVIFSDSYPLSATDTRPLAAKAASFRSQAIYVAGLGPAYINMFKSLKESGYQGQLIADMSFSFPPYLKALGVITNEVIFMGTKALLLTYEGRKSDQSGIFPLLHVAECAAYDTLAVAENLATRNEPFTQAAFGKMKSWQGVAGTYSFLTNGQCELPMFLIKPKSR